MIKPRWTLLTIRNVPDKSCRANKTTFYVQTLFFPPWKSCRLWHTVEKIWYNQAGHAWQYDALQKTRALHAGLARPETHTYSISYSLLHVWLIPSDILKCFVATVTKIKNLKPLICHYDLLCQVCVWRRPETNIFLLPCSLCHFARRPTYVLF